MRNLIFLLVVSFVLIGCTKEGPEGPQGPPGTTNITTSTFTNRSFAANPLVPTIFQTDLNVPAITNAVMQGGLVSVFISEANNNNAYWFAIPGNFNPNPATTSLRRFFNYQISSGSVVVFTTDGAPGYNADIKVVVVPAP